MRQKTEWVRLERAAQRPQHAVNVRRAAFVVSKRGGQQLKPMSNERYSGGHVCRRGKQLLLARGLNGFPCQGVKARKWGAGSKRLRVQLLGPNLEQPPIGAAFTGRRVVKERPGHFRAQSGADDYETSA